MKVKITKKMVNEIKKAFAKIEKVKNYDVEYVKMSSRQYNYCVDFDNKSMDYDYNWLNGEWVVIKILYPNEYYAMPKYITTVDLLNIFRKSNKTLDGFMQELADFLEV